MAELNGYHLLAHLMTTEPQLSFFRSFAQLHIYDVLTQQAELTWLEDHFYRVVFEDRDSGDPKKVLYEFSVNDLRGPHEDDPDRALQWDKVLELRAKLKEHEETVSRCERVLKRLRCPRSGQDLATLREWLPKQNRGRLIRSLEPEAWHPEQEQDLICLSSTFEEKDTFSRFVHERGLRWYHDLIGHKLHDHAPPASPPDVERGPPSPSSPNTTPLTKDLTTYSDKRLARLVGALATVLASLLPTLSIFGLYFVHEPLAQIGTIVGTTFVFSAAVTLFTTADDAATVFVAAATFAAVQVVFLGGNGCVATATAANAGAGGV